MRLTKLELHGFKSFADRVELVFEPGVTAIVGPNGCGKSNVSDAVRWVLGEQRARALRGAKMEEVIFQGSSARRAVNIAEVSLHFENDDGQLPVPYREVVITRRLSRSGESDYLLNRVPCRLRDIHDLVRGTGLGADSGVVIEARMIDALLSDRPDERRELFEEAAGVGLYRDRRRTTERRLEETTVDLARLDDLITEVQSQVRSLARQRKRAEKHTELTARRFTMELTLASREMDAWHDELARLEGRVAALTGEEPGAQDRVRVAERGREEAQVARATAEGRRAELARLVSAQQQDVMRLDGELRVAEERQRNASARRQRAEEERRQSEEYGSQLARDRAQLLADRERLDADLSSVREALARHISAEEVARSAVVSARSAYDESDRAVRALQDEERRAGLDREGADREQEEVADRLAAMATEGEQLTLARDQARDDLERAERALLDARRVLATHAGALAATRSAAEAARAAESAARGELLRAEELNISLQGKVSALEALEQQRVGLAPAAARLLRDRERFGHGAILGPLSDYIGADTASATSVEKFLGATVHAVLVRDRAVADEIRGWHAAIAPGPLLLLPLDAREEAPASESGLAGTVESLGPARGWVSALLGRAHAIDGGSAFVDDHGAVWLPGSSAGPGPLRRRAELSALRAELEASASALVAASGRADRARAVLDDAERALSLAAETASSADLAARRASEERDESERRHQRAERELATVEQSVARLAERRTDISVRAASLDAHRSELGQRIAQQESALARARDRHVQATLLQDAAREERTRWQVEQAQLQAREQVADDRERRLSDERANADSRIRLLLAELSDIEQADGVLVERMTGWRMDLEARRQALQDGEASLASAEHAVHLADGALVAAAQALDAVRQHAVTLAEELHRSALRLAELSGRRTAIRERLEAEWRRPLEEMLATLTPVELDDQALHSELGRIREELESIGAVNPLAIEEHEEETKRFDYLSTQRTDLTSARNSLQQAIREIDVTARELFLATFTQVRENFRQIFMTLFGGGECDLRLENPDAPLDCDIEIHASPRGKRTQRIHLLSSGERALVALSLLFGIFLTKPSPFCLLDEVDAPLDDQNVARFVRMLNQFKARTQFIVITHNPRTTTEAADTVYGVTMQEPGVSSFVSVHMRGAAVDDALDDETSDVEAVTAPV
ncbi:MAG: chromosome segregation protein SMC [Gemmatimonadota bacterium]|nr:chromosome segregation protein SMC [Gemmatimonadota bacterium]